jgi:predicted dithiol-disulfide oxidoreductase (DUF899 family)
LAKEKAASRQLAALAEARRALPAVAIDKDFGFEGPDGKVGLIDLFEGRSQLIVYHFMWLHDIDEGCPRCSFVVDNMPDPIHLNEGANTTLALVSRVPYPRLRQFKARMGWRLPWYSSHGSDFNYDFRVSFTPEQVAKGEIDYNYGTWPHAYEEWPGISAFYKDDAGDVFHTYSTYGRGVEVMMHTYAMLDLMPKGRDERDVEYKMDWVRHHDRYDSAPLSKTGSVEELHGGLKKEPCH